MTQKYSLHSAASLAGASGRFWWADYLRKHYSKYLIRLATADLMSMRQDIGLGGEMMREGDDFILRDEATK